MAEYPRFDGTQSCNGMKQFTVEVSPGLAPMHQRMLREVCNSCSWLNECREFAVHHELLGFMGGLSADQRRQERKRRNILLTAAHVIGSGF